MPNEALSLAQEISKYGYIGVAWLLFLSFWAGAVRYFRGLHGEKPTFLGFLVEVISSGFVGVMVAMVCRHYELDFLIASAITGSCAFQGTKALNMLILIVKRTSGSVIGSIVEGRKNE